MAVPALQVHASRHCNLRCLHCYSESGPDQRDALPLDVLERLVGHAADEGYRVLSLSGGEPLLYGGSPALLRRAHERGMSTTLTTNGTLLRPRFLEPVAEHLDLLAISLDGVPESHDRMRAHPKAFELLRTGLAEVHRLGLPFGLIFTLTQHNVDELRWVAGFAAEAGAKLLQIHPLEAVGRARSELPESAPDDRERFFGWTEALAAQAMVGERLRVQLDLATVSALGAERHLRNADLPPSQWQRPLAELCAPLVLEPDGVLVPLTYGFPRHLAVGDVTREDLPEAATRWRSRYGDFTAHCARAYGAAQRAGGLVNWFEVVSA